MWYKSIVGEDYESKVRAMSVEKAMTVASYGESVAAYRYRTLSEKTTSESHRAVFVEMAQEEQGHHLLVQNLLRELFPGTGFLLTAEDKELVTVGSRMIEVTDSASFERAMTLLVESERQTGRFYAVLHEITTHPRLKPLFKEMADECVEHAERLLQITPPA